MMYPIFCHTNHRNQYPLHVWSPRILSFVPVELREV